MLERRSPLGNAFRPGTYGNTEGGPGVVLREVTPPAILEVAAWPENNQALLAALKTATGLSIDLRPNAGASNSSASIFAFGPNRYLVTGAEDLPEKINVPMNIGTVTDLSHGRTAIRVEGKRAEWVLAKLLAIDFAQAAFPVNFGKATAHHDISVQIHRTGETRFDLFVFRSFARAFWVALCDAAQEVGYEVPPDPDKTPGNPNQRSGI